MPSVLRDLEATLKRVVFGQNAAIDALSSSIKLARAGLREPEKPIGNYLFAGPTGVGKTEVAKQLAASLGVEMLRFDMSEYMEKHAVSRLIGAPPGYVGFDQGGLLTDGVDQHPHCVLLLDEIEKAHPDVFNILLQVMDHGKLTDHNGRQVDFRNVILIMTSNAGASELAKSAIGFGRDRREGEDTAAIERTFTPEFRNRLDAVISFAPLGKDVILQVVEKFVLQLEAQLMDRNVSIELSPEAAAMACRQGLRRQDGRASPGSGDPGADQEAARRGAAVRQAAEGRPCQGRRPRRRHPPRGRSARDAAAGLEEAAASDRGLIEARHALGVRGQSLRLPRRSRARNLSGPRPKPRLEPAKHQRQPDRHHQVDQRHDVVGLEIPEVARRRHLAELRDVEHPQHRDEPKSFTIATKSLPRGGRIVRNACGNTTSRNRCQGDRPSALAASICPRSTLWSPARNTSARKAE